MSDVWQGPGWWLASDGKWYPADAQPGGGADPGETATESAVESSTDTTSTLVADPITPAATAAPVVEAPAPDPAPAPVTPAPAPVTPPPAAPPIDPEPAAAPRGGWQAVEQEPEAAEPAPQPEVPAGEWTEPAVAAADTPSLDSVDDGWTSAYDDSNVAEVAVAEVETIVPAEMPEAPRFEVPEVEAPSVGTASIPDVAVPPAVSVPDVAPPTIEVPNIPAAEPIAPDVTPPTFGIPDVAAPAASIIDPVAPGEPVVPERLAPEPLARDDAWRKPGTVTPEQAAPIDGTPLRPAPEVVDLAIPPESPLNPQWTPPESTRSPLRGILTALLVLLVIVGLAIAIGWFFTRDSGDSTDDTIGTDDTTVTTDASAPSTAAEETVAPTVDPTAGREVSVFELRAGDCIQGEIGSGQVQQLIKVDCSVPHEFEVYREALIDSSVTSFDEAAISAQAEEVCRTSLAAYIPPDDDRDLKFKWFQPTEESWNQETDPDRVITCLLFDEEGPLTGRAA